MATETRPYKFTNNVTLELADDIDDAVELINVVDDDALPVLEDDEICTIVLRDDANNKYEVMNVTSHGGNVLAVERGAEGTDAFEWPAGTVIQHALTAMFFTKLTALPAAFFRTSKPYPYVFIEALEHGGTIEGVGPVVVMRPEALNFGAVPVSGDIRAALLRYLNYEPEAIEHSIDIISAGLAAGLQTYDNYPPEAMDFAAIPLEGDVRDALIRYLNYQDEALDFACVPVSGALT